MRLQIHFLHRLLILLLQLVIESNMLVDCQGFTATVAGDQLEFRIGQAAVPSQPRNRLVPKRVRRGLYTGSLCVLLHDLLHTAGRILRVTSGLEQPPVRRMSSNVRP